MYSRYEDVDKVCDDRCRSGTKFCVFTSPDFELTDTTCAANNGNRS